VKLLIVGPPGSGKSTQAELLEKELGLPHLSTGELFHYISTEKTPRGRQIKEIMESGGLIDDKSILEIVEERLRDKQYRRGFILDGTPRSLLQAQNLKVKFDRVFSLEVSDKKTTIRLSKRGRGDTDKPAVIKKRLAVYHRETEPMLDYYRQLGVLTEVDGERSIEDIFKDLREQLD